MVQINRGGEKISPLEVDAALLSVEGVGEAVAFGVADEKFGEKVRCFLSYKNRTCWMILMSDGTGLGCGRAQAGRFGFGRREGYHQAVQD